MTSADWMVVAAGAAAILWVNWYFFLASRTTAAARVGASGRDEVEIAVRGGYDPAEIRVRRGVPVRLVFDRQETSGCSEEVVIPEFGVRKYLPAHQRTAVDLTPQAAGAYEFTCGMGMLRGRIVVEEGI